MLPAALGVAAGWFLLWWDGWAFVFEGPAAVEGYGWPGYLNNAWMVFHQTDVGYDLFRLPLHGALVGSAGEATGSYVAGAVVVSSLAMGAAVLAAAVLGAALSGPWAGGAAAVLLALVVHNTDASRWANSYPLQAGLGGAALALGVLAARFPQARTALAAGLVAGLAGAVDGRAGLIAAGAAAVSFLSLAESPRRRTVWVPVLVVAGLGLSPVLTAALDVTGGALPPLHEKVEFQRGVALRWASMARDNHGEPDRSLQAACSGQPPLERPSLEALLRPCGREMSRHNWAVVLPRHLPLGPGMTFGLGLLLLLPGRQGWRGSLRGAGFLVAALLPVALESRWVPFPDRYLVPRCVVWAVLAPAGVVRLVSLVPGPWGPRLSAAACAGLVGWVVATDATGRGHPTALQQGAHGEEQRSAIQTVLGLHDGQPLLDCSGQYTQTALLPSVLGPSPPLLRLVEGSRCVAWVQEAPPGAWLLADDGQPLRVHQEGQAPRMVSLDRPWLEGEGWRQVAERKHFQVWKRQ